MEKFMKNAVINARIESELKVDVESILKNLGLSATQAINMFYQQIKLHNGIPFEVKIPNAETQKVIEESRKGINVEDFSFEELEHK
jgi:DNA-damage-inducible protein J